MPKISVIMPFYNCEKFLDESISSILNQTFSDFEFIIINDASTDNSDEIIKKYLSDKRIIYIKNIENKWIVFNLNNAINIVKWEYIARMDGDDISSSNRFQKQLDFLEKNKNICLVWSFMELIDENWNKIWESKKNTESYKIKKDLFLYSQLNHNSIMIKAEILKKYKYREEFLYCEDYDLRFRLIYSWIEAWNIPENLLKYRIHPNSSNKNSKLIAKRVFSLRKWAIKEFNLKIWLKWYLWMYIHYFLWLILNWRQKAALETYIKKLFFE